MGEAQKNAFSEAVSSIFVLRAHFFGIVKGEQPLTRCGESGVQR